MLKLIDIDEDNWRPNLNVAKEQEHFVSDSMKLLARAYAYRNSRSRAFIISDDETPIGMGLYYDCESLKSYDLSQVFIDERYQGKGYGKETIKLILDLFRKERKYNKVVLCYVEGNIAAKRLYEGFGFIETNREENEIVMELELK